MTESKDNLICGRPPTFGDPDQIKELKRLERLAAIFGERLTEIEKLIAKAESTLDDLESEIDDLQGAYDKIEAALDKIQRAESGEIVLDAEDINDIIEALGG